MEQKYISLAMLTLGPCGEREKKHFYLSPCVLAPFAATLCTHQGSSVGRRTGALEVWGLISSTTCYDVILNFSVPLCKEGIWTESGMQGDGMHLEQNRVDNSNCFIGSWGLEEIMCKAPLAQRLRYSRCSTTIVIIVVLIRFWPWQKAEAAWNAVLTGRWDPVRTPSVLHRNECQNHPIVSLWAQEGAFPGMKGIPGFLRPLPPPTS